MAEKLQQASVFEIHCWNEKTEEIEMALQFGGFRETAWQYGKLICGPVTPEFSAYLLSLPKPTESDTYNKMTPFFTIVLDNSFWSEHYGTELNQL